MSLKISNEGSVYTYNLPKSFDKKFTYLLLITMIIGLLLTVLVIFVQDIFIVQYKNGSFEFPFGFGITISTLFFIILLLTYLTTRPEKILSIDLNTKEIQTKEGDFVIDKDAVLILDRSIIKSITTSTQTTSSGSSTTSTQVLILAKWEISTEKENGNYVIFKKTSKINYPIMDQLIEHIAELLNIPIVDRTGIEVIKRHPGETDIPLVEKLQKEGKDPIHTLPTSEKFPIEESNGGYKMILDKQSTFTMIAEITVVIIGGIITFFLLGNEDLAIFAIFPAILMIFTFFYVLFRLGRKTLIQIDHSGVHLKDKRWFYRSSTDIPLFELERLHIIDYLDKRALEFVSDEKRILVKRQLPANDLPEVIDRLEGILVTVA